MRKSIDEVWDQFQSSLCALGFKSSSSHMFDGDGDDYDSECNDDQYLWFIYK